MASYKIVTLDDIMALDPGLYYIEIHGPSSHIFSYEEVTGYTIGQKDTYEETEKYIRDFPKIIGLDISDYKHEGAELPTYINSPQRELLSEKFIETDYKKMTIKGLIMRKIPKGTLFYKGITPFIDDDSVYKSRSGVSFYTNNPVYAMEYSYVRGIGGLYVYSAARDIIAFDFCKENIQKIMNILEEYPDEKVKSALRLLFSMQCLNDNDDILSRYIYWSAFHELRAPWKINKYTVNKYKNYPCPCPGKLYGMKMDRIINPLLIALGKLVGYDCTYQMEEFSLFAINSLFGNELVFPTDTNILVRNSSHILDVANWRLPKEILSMRIVYDKLKNAKDASRVYEYIMKRQKTIIPKKERGHIRVCTYNVNSLIPLDSNDSRDTYGEIISMIIKLDIDVIVLQEFPKFIPARTINGYTFYMHKDSGGKPWRYSKDLTVVAYYRNDRCSCEFKRYPGVYNKAGRGALVINHGPLTIVGTELSHHVTNEKSVRDFEMSEISLERPDVIMGMLFDTEPPWKKEKEGDTTPDTTPSHSAALGMGGNIMYNNDTCVSTNYLVVPEEKPIFPHKPVMADIRKK